jgi:hypothetical protein
MKPILEYILNKDTKVIKNKVTIKTGRYIVDIFNELKRSGYEKLDKGDIYLGYIFNSMKFFDSSEYKKIFTYDDNSIYVCNKYNNKYKYVGIRIQEDKITGSFVVYSENNWGKKSNEVVEKYINNE